ncbi:MAG: Peptidase family [Micavibrio sp.]|nr:Peptidase family [Micavibrio sp.]
MDIFTKLKFKSVFLRAALHLQMAPMLFIPSLLVLKEQYFTTRNGFIKFIGADIGRDRGALSSPVPENHPIHHLIAPLAEKSNLDIVSVVAEGYGLSAAMINQGRFVKLFVSYNLLDDAIRNPSLVSGIIGHELTHAARRIGSDIHFAERSRIFSLIAGCCYLPLFQSSPAMVLGAASLFSAACGIPIVARAFARNEEHLADIGSVRLTGDPQSLLAVFGARQSFDKGGFFYAAFGPFHPSFAERFDVLRSIFNARSMDIPGPANDTEPAPVHQDASKPERKQKLG